MVTKSTGFFIHTIMLFRRKNIRFFVCFFGSGEEKKRIEMKNGEMIDCDLGENFFRGKRNAIQV